MSNLSVIEHALPVPMVRAVRSCGGSALRTLVALAGPKLFGTLTHVETDEPLVALTFDDGPHPEFTPQLLDVLDRHQAKATFFVIGTRAQARPDLVDRVARAGHAIGNHTWDHLDLTKLGRRARRTQLQRCSSLIEPYATGLFRPPWGYQTLWSRIDALGHEVVAWNVHARDWLVLDANVLTSTLEGEIGPGSIVLLHDAIWNPIVDGASDRRPVIKAVDNVLQKLGSQYQFVTVPELIRRGRPVRVNWYNPVLWW